MDSAAAASLLFDPNTPAASSSVVVLTPEAECLREMLTIRRPAPPFLTSYDRQTQRVPLPRRSPANNPVIAELMNTVAQARDRKRQREEAFFNRRDVGQQTEADSREFTQEDGISATKRVRREVEPTGLHTQVSTNATNVCSEDLPAQPSSSVPPNRNYLPPSSSGSTSTSNYPSTAFQDAHRLAQRNARRAQRTRRIQQAETLRLQMENSPATAYLQQINGIVPGSDHNCDIRCQLHNHTTATPAAAGPHSVSPTIAPHIHVRHPLAPPTYSIFGQLARLNHHPTLHMPTVMMGVSNPLLLNTIPVAAPSIPVPQPAPAYQSMYGWIANNVPISAMAPPEYLSNFLRAHHDMMLPPFDRMGLDRHHMFAGLDLDVPVGASRVEIDSFTTAEPYKRPDGEEEEETCTVCLCGYEDGENVRKLPCKHFFHPNCIDKWLDINKRCPMCREEIDRNRAA
uniref:RING-type domain-containing protein n=1 Tax=Caenorhabditis japonica TaxID=281687 RepID=A0A8R1DE62_CAEJA